MSYSIYCIINIEVDLQTKAADQHTYTALMCSNITIYQAVLITNRLSTQNIHPGLQPIVN